MAIDDVEALYSSIPHEKGGTVLMEQERTSWPLNQFMLQLLSFILTRNFIFEDQYFLQAQGMAMGTSCAPSYANLYLGAWESSNFPMTNTLSLCSLYYVGIDS